MFPGIVKAITRWDGIFSLENRNVSIAKSSSNLFQGRIDLDVKPPTKKRLDARFNIRVNFTESDKERIWDLSPIGNLGVDIRGESFSMNVKHTNSAQITSSADLIETRTSRAAFSLSPPNLPRVIADYSTTDTSSAAGTDTRSDIFSFFSDYRYKWMNFSGGYSKQKRFSGRQVSLTSDSFFLGIGGSYEVLPRTILLGDFDFNQSSSDNQRGFRSTTDNRVFKLGVDSRPFAWFDLIGNFSKDITDNESDTAEETTNERQNMDLTARLYPFHSLQLWTTVGNRKFEDVAVRARSVDFVTVAASFRDDLQENIQMGLNISRTTETDPDQGENIRDNFGFNSTMDLTPRVSARINLNISRSEIPGFISTPPPPPPGAQSGTFADRTTYDGEAAGFTFFDTDNNDLYTKNSIILADWSDPVHIDDLVTEQLTEQYSVTKTVVLNMVPTDKTSFVLSYTSNSSADRLDIATPGNQSINSSLSYRPNLRTSYSLTGTASLPQTGDESYGGTLSMAYRFYRRHQMNLSYSSRITSEETSDTFTGSLRFTLRKKANMEMTYSTSQLFEDDQSIFFRVRYSKYF